MQSDGYLTTDLRTAGAQAARLESEGYLGAFTAETSHDPFLPLVVAAQATDRLELGTSIAVAFARNPMTMAHTARDLNEFSEGRMILGLGSQIKPHITKRFSMPWSAPAARMREFIGAMYAIWDCWDTGDPLRFKGDYYTHILMTEFFNPGPARHGKPAVYLAAVGPLMVQLTAEVCDGWMVHPFTTPQHFSNVALPRMRGFMDEAGRTHDSVKVALPAFVVTGDEEEAMASAAVGIKQQIGFYGSTPAYRDVLDFHGWGDAQAELNTLTKSGRWDELADVIDDEMLATFAVVAEPEYVERELEARYGGLVDRISRYTVPL
jgi:probable F420-dependent oxidoreductase